MKLTLKYIYSRQPRLHSLHNCVITRVCRNPVLTSWYKHRARPVECAVFSLLARIAEVLLRRQVGAEAFANNENRSASLGAEQCNIIWGEQNGVCGKEDSNRFRDFATAKVRGMKKRARIRKVLAAERDLDNFVEWSVVTFGIRSRHEITARFLPLGDWMALQLKLARTTLVSDRAASPAKWEGQCVGLKAKAQWLVGARVKLRGGDECKIDGIGRGKKRKRGRKGEVGLSISRHRHWHSHGISHMGRSRPIPWEEMGRPLIPMGGKAISLPTHGIPSFPCISHDTKVYN
jgi:hypothetical protein